MLAIILREDPSLNVTLDPESGQTHLAGMGELHLEIARDRLIGDFKVKASAGKIQIGYREAILAASAACTEIFDRRVANKDVKSFLYGFHITFEGRRCRWLRAFWHVHEYIRAIRLQFLGSQHS